MDNRILVLLESNDPAKREKGIKALAADGSEDALRQLALVYKRERDPRLKKLVIKAGQYIKKRQQELYYDDLYDDDDEYDYYDDDLLEEEATPKKKNGRVEVSRDAKMKAQTLMNEAIMLTATGTNRKKHKKARELIHEGFKTDPNLQHDAYYLGVAADILDVPEHQVGVFILGDDAHDVHHAVLKSAKSGDKLKRRERKDGFDYEGEATWTTASTSLAIYWLLSSTALLVVTILFVTAVNGLFGDIFQALVDSGEITGEEAGNIITQCLYIFLRPDEVIELFIFTLSLVGTNLAWTVIYLWMINIIAGAWVGGDGTLRGLIHTSAYFITAMDVFRYIWTALLFYLFFAAMTDAIRTDILYPNTDFSIIYSNYIAQIDSVLPTLVLAGMLGLCIYLIGWAWVVGRAYKFGAGKGCQTLILFVMVLIFCNCFFSFVATLIPGGGV